MKLTSGLEECEVKNAIENNDPVSKLTIETELNSEKTKRHSSIKSVNKISEDVVLSLDAIEEIATSSFVPAILQELPATNISSITFENFKLINPTTTESTTTESTSSKLVTKSSSTFSESIPIELIDPTQLTVRNLNSNEKLNEEQTMTSLFLTAELKSVVIDCLSLVQNENESSIADSESEINTTCIDTNTLSLPFIDSLQNQDQNETNLIPKKPFHGVDMKIDTHSAIIRCKGMTNPPQNMIYQNKGHFREGNEQKESFNFTTHQFLSSVASFDESQLPFVNEPNDAYNSPCIPSFMHSRSCLDLKTETQELIVSFDTKDDDELSPQADDDIVVDALLELVKLITPLRGVELQISLLKHYMNQIQFINMNQPVKLDINVVEELCSAVMSVSLENHAYMIFEVLEEALEESRIKTIQKNKNVVGLGFDMTVNLIGQAQDKIELWFDTQVQANKPELVLSKELAVMIREFEESVESEIKKE